MEFRYDANHNRYLKKSSDGTDTFYFGKTYERITNSISGETQHKHFVYADGKLIALNTQTRDSSNQLKNKQVRYLHYDALNSVDMITDGYGNVVERSSYDTWGKKRAISWQSNSPAEVLQSAITNRGYTGHEHIEEVGLIHMNGRVYDQELGRFLSADPHIQAPYLANSFNRYSYVMNNPLKYTDPKGYWFSDSDGNGLTGECRADGTSYNGITGQTSHWNQSNGSNSNSQQKVKTEITLSKSTQAAEILTSPYVRGAIEPIYGRAYVGFAKYLVNSFIFGIVYGEISSINALNSDPIDRADIEAYVAVAGYSRYMAELLPVARVRTAAEVVGGLVTKIGTFPTKFHKRSIEEVAQLRKEFESIKPEFVRSYANSAEAANRFTPQQIAKMTKSGKIPKGFVIHHKDPLFRGVITHSITSG